MKKQEIFNRLFNEGISYTEYTKRSKNNIKRMKDCWLASQEAIRQLQPDLISRLDKKLRVLCIAESGCIDCKNGIPVIAGLVKKISNWDFRIVYRDEFPKEVETFYTTIGRKKIPVIIFADKDGDEIMRWVERPMRSYSLLGMLRDQSQSKNEFSEKYQKTTELQPPSVTKEILRELLVVAEKAASIVHLNPPEKKNPK